MFALPTLLSVQSSDSVRRVADTLFFEPLSVRATVPALWMGRVSEGVTALAPGRGRFGCQIHVEGPADVRVIVNASQLATIGQGLYGPRRSYQDALDSILPRGSLLAHVGGDRFNGNCVAPQIHLYVVDAASVQPTSFASRVEAVAAQQYSGIQRAEIDSASWHIVRVSWTDNKTDFIKPATLEIYARRIGARLLLVAVMDGWAAQFDTEEFLNSIR